MWPPTATSGRWARVTITGRREAGEVVLAVADSGPGVPDESLAKLFDPFYRVDESRTRETGGVGLGLTIVKTCVESCGGSVNAGNRPEGGLRVEIRLQPAPGPSDGSAPRTRSAGPSA